MKMLTSLLKIVAPIFVLVSAMHLLLGAGADVMLGANLSPQVLSDPVLDSQNRFYGVVFALYGVLLYLCATNISKYATVLRCLAWVFFAGGLARLVSIAIVGMPTAPVIGLLALELVLPPLLLRWLSKAQRDGRLR